MSGASGGDGLEGSWFHALPQVQEHLINAVDADQSHARELEIENDINRQHEHQHKGERVKPVADLGRAGR